MHEWEALTYTADRRTQNRAIEAAWRRVPWWRRVLSYFFFP